MFWVVAAISLVMTIILLSGKGAFLVAGFNTASSAEKLKYDEKKLSRVAGIGMGVITICSIVLGCLGDNAPESLIFAFTVAIGVVTIAIVILCNTICKSKNATNSVAGVSVGKSKSNLRSLSITLVSVVIIFAIVGVALSTGEIKTIVDGNNIKIDGTYWTDCTVNLDSVNSVSSVENIEIGKRINGMGSFKLAEGSFKNSEYGDYILYAYNSCKSYIVLDTTDKTVVINAKTPEETQKLFQQIDNAVSK